MVPPSDEHDMIAEVVPIAEESSTGKERKAKSDETYLWINALIRQSIIRLALTFKRQPADFVRSCNL